MKPMILILLLAVAGCDSQKSSSRVYTVPELVSQADRLKGKTVTVKGEVLNIVQVQRSIIVYFKKENGVGASCFFPLKSEPDVNGAGGMMTVQGVVSERGKGYVNLRRCKRTFD